MYNTSSVIPLTGSAIGTDILLTLSYVALGLPYMYRAVDTGMRTIDVQTLTEAATIMGARQWTIITRIILPNILIAVLSGAFLTFAIVIGEFTMASLLGRPAFGVYLQRIGISKSYEPAALAVISFIITWGAMGMIQLLSRFAPRTSVRNA
jgi:putative spermidine/putrescine transport system permease protein